MRKLFLVATLLTSMTMSGADVVSLDSMSCRTVMQTVEANKPDHLLTGKIVVKHAEYNPKKKKLQIDLNENFSYIPLSGAFVDSVRQEILEALGSSYAGYKVDLTVEGRPIESYLTDYDHDYKMRTDKPSFVYALDDLRHPSKGLDGKIIAMWQSHGWYFEQKNNRWQWQRARIFETVEDLYTQSYVMPFLMPMLENAGAYVMSPRERDTNVVEIIVDNDGGLAQKDGYSENNGEGEYAWKAGENAGFGYYQSSYKDFENPFRAGSYRMAKTTKGKDKDQIGKITWSADIPKDGRYAVYVSYATVDKSAEDAVYKVLSAEGEKSFRVNQTMGGGTWVYLGHFYFLKGSQAIVELQNVSAKKNRVITADAVKIGGGYGNIARSIPDAPADSEKSEPEYFRKLKSDPVISGYPRFTEGARYWLQWAGMPDSVYSPTGGANDYNDDYRCRGEWVNYLAGGSYVLPERKGLNIPVDLSFAFHSDAGTTMNDSIIGTLGIFFSQNGAKYATGTDRLNSYFLTDMVMTNIVNDVRRMFDSSWTRRGMWDASYYEARVPEVPAMLLELLSHQNLADMRYGLDPTFRFTVSRAIYKGMVQFFANREGRGDDYVIQPLPVNSFAIHANTDGTFRLTWKETVDTLCDKAAPTRYVVYERIGDGGFRQIAVTEKPEYTVSVNDNHLHSYQIVAANDGGLSFPSEILSLGVPQNAKGTVLVVNGFTRLSAPDSFVSDGIAGFHSERDNGVPYLQDISFIGKMFEFRRSIPWTSDDSAGFGASRADYEDKVVAGNTFDYPAIHGESIMNAGYAFVSTSVKAVEDGDVALDGFCAVDLILGKQKEIQIGRGEMPNRFAIYSSALQKAVSAYCGKGGNVLVTGAYVATDVWDNPNSDEAKRNFAENVLGYKWRVGQAATTGKAHTVNTYFPQFKSLDVDFYNTWNGDFYAVESPDAMYPTDDKYGCTLLRYNENGIAAGIVNAFDNYRTCVIGFPFETIKDSADRDSLMRQVLDFFNAK